MSGRKIVFLLVSFFVFSTVGIAFGNDLPQFTDLAKESGSAVVNISTVKVVETSKRLKKFFNPFQDRGGPFDEFFDKFFEDMPQKRQQHALGSGFIISNDGYIVTNNHVIEKADKIEVNLQGGKESYRAKVVGKDPETDLALLKIDVKNDLPVLEFGDSDELEVGQWIMAIGNPFGLDHTVTAGIISAKGRVIGAGPYDNFLQTDASINPGNSGGPLLNMEGKVIGINTAIVASGQGIGFAIPSNMAKDVISQLQKYKEVRRGWLGVTIQDVDENIAKALGMSESKGALVASVKSGDPAAKAGIQVGDVIISVNGDPVKGASDLTRTIGQMSPGQTIDMTVWREGKVKELQVTLGQRDLETAQREEPQKEADSLLLGMQLKPVNEQEAEALGLESPVGLLVTGVQDNSAADQEGIYRGDVILKANGKVVDNVSEIKDIIKQSKKKGVVMFLISRKGRNLFKTIPLE